MQERLFRANASKLQTLYDRMPFPVRTALVSARGLFLSRNRYSAAMYALLKDLRARETWTLGQMRQYQLQQAQYLLDMARSTVPFYADYPALKLRDIEALAALPVLTRPVVYAAGEQLVNRAIPERDRVYVSTTGTTGGALRIYYSTEVARRYWAFRMRQWAWHGISPRPARITLFGSRVTPANRMEPPFWAFNLPERQILLSIYHLSAATASSYVKFLKRHSGRVLEGFPSTLGILADLILRQNETVRMRIIFTDGEPLYPFLREKIERAFQAEIYDLYGNTEFAGLMQECEYHRMHQICDYAYLEILDEENRPVPAGQEGYLVWTSFANDVMPLIRYRIGDRGCMLTEKACRCGRSFPLVVPTITRESDLLECPDGRIFSPRALNQLLKNASAFRFCQFVQLERDSVVVRAVAANNRSAEELSMVRQDLQSLLGKGIRVTGELAAEPIVRAGGKIPLIVRKVAA